jgi:hypothetical protein
VCSVYAMTDASIFIIREKSNRSVEVNAAFFIGEIPEDGLLSQAETWRNKQ